MNGINQQAPVVGASEIEIAAAPEAVWAVVTEFERWPSWNPDVKSMGDARRCRRGIRVPLEGRARDDHVDHPSRRAAFPDRLDRQDAGHQRDPFLVVRAS